VLASFSDARLGLDCAHRRTHRPNMIWDGAAASAHNLRTGRNRLTFNPQALREFAKRKAAGEPV